MMSVPAGNDESLLDTASEPECTNLTIFGCPTSGALVKENGLCTFMKQLMHDYTRTRSSYPWWLAVGSWGVTLFLAPRIWWVGTPGWDLATCALDPESFITTMGTWLWLSSSELVSTPNFTKTEWGMGLQISWSYLLERWRSPENESDH